MTTEAKKTLDLPVKNTASNTDVVVVISGFANSSIAQTALISVTNLMANTPGLVANVATIQIQDIRSDPANSTALTIAQGTVFFTNSYGYFATQNNYVKRWPITNF